MGGPTTVHVTLICGARSGRGLVCWQQLCPNTPRYQKCPWGWLHASPQSTMRQPTMATAVAFAHQCAQSKQLTRHTEQPSVHAKEKGPTEQPSMSAAAPSCLRPVARSASIRGWLLATACRHAADCVCANPLCKHTLLMQLTSHTNSQPGAHPMSNPVVQQPVDCSRHQAN
jgi:hypothetical protein